VAKLQLFVSIAGAVATRRQNDIIVDRSLAVPCWDGMIALGQGLPNVFHL
jgi:hypothetical protein